MLNRCRDGGYSRALPPADATRTTAMEDGERRGAARTTPKGSEGT